jgi:ABC-type spermidine/putrescine transport system permease subunit II
MEMLRIVSSMLAARKASRAASISSRQTLTVHRSDQSAAADQSAVADQSAAAVAYPSVAVACLSVAAAVAAVVVAAARLNRRCSAAQLALQQAQ